MADKKPLTYFWDFVCQRGCSIRKASTDIHGDPKWASEVCSFDQTSMKEVEPKA